MKPVLSFVLIALGASSVWAQSPPPELTLSGEAGWGARACPGDWVPVEVEIDNIGPDRDLVLALSWASGGLQQPAGPLTPQSLSGRCGPIHTFDVGIARNTRKRISTALLAPDSGSLSVWAFALSRDGRKRFAQTELLVRFVPPQEKLIAIVGTVRPPGLDRPQVETILVAPERLPEDRRAYASLEALLWLDGKASDLRPAQTDALASWISCGGHLVLARSQLVGLSGTLVADLLPVKLRGGREIESLEMGRVFPEGNLPDPAKILVLDSAVLRGKVRHAAGPVPLVVESCQGGGRVTFVAFDPTLLSVAKGPGFSKFWDWVLPLDPAVVSANETDSRKAPRHLGSVGLTDLARQFPDVAPPAIGGLFALILAYLVVVGPLDYGVLRLFRRLELTWLTFPAYVVAFTLFILVAGGAFVRSAAHQREVAVIDSFVEGRFVRTRALGAILAAGETSLSFEDAQPVSTDFVTRSFYRETGQDLSDIRVAHATREVVREFTLARGATGLVAVDRASQEPCRLGYTLERREGGALQVKIENGTGLEFEGMELVTPDGVYFVGSVGPGGTQVEPRRRYKTLEEYSRAEGTATSLSAATEDDEYIEERGRVQRRSGRITEQALGALAHPLLIGLSFPPERGSARPAASGLARGFDATDWIRSGGSVLLGWVRSPGCALEFTPQPARRTSVVLARFFQGAGK
jgi:hypothetical protein